MEKKFFTLLFSVFSISLLQAQTWNGNTNTDWNTAGNWSSNTVPAVTAAVTIPNTANKPVLASNVTVASISMNSGSALNFNGFTFTVTGDFDFQGASFNNTNGATDIVLSLINGGGSNYFRGNTINDNITINYNGASPIYEGYTAGNIYNGNASFNIGGSGIFYLCYDNRSSFNGNLIINRTVAGTSEIFRLGANPVAGNFSYTNNVGGTTAINQYGPLTTVAGTINISSNPVGFPAFMMNKIKNGTTGGTISVQKPGQANFGNDTLQLTSFNINYFKSAGTTDFVQNSITAAVDISDSTGNTGDNYFRSNVVNGSTSYTINSTGTFYEAYTGGNTYNGNVNFKAAGAAVMYLCYDNKSTFNGNVTVNRTVAGQTDIFRVGANAVNGNFTYTNNVGGATYINQYGGQTVLITGTINITSNPIGFPPFILSRIKNQTNGGTISIQKSGLLTIAYDTLQVAALNANYFKSASTSDLLQNTITGTVNISDSTGNTGGTYIRKNVINGNTTFVNNSSGILYEAYQGGNIYNGNASFTIAGTGTTYICYDSKSTFNGSLTINRTAPGASYILQVGFNALTGNFGYNNSVGGATYINQSNSLLPAITGTVNIVADGPGNPAFLMMRINNLITGGTVSVQNSGNVNISYDTLQLTALNVNGFSSTGTSDFLQNLITGTVNISDAVTNGSTYFRRNLINGNTTITQNGNYLYEAYQGANTYNGNLTLIRNAGTVSFAYDNPTNINQNFTINSTAGIIFTQPVRFGGSTSGIIEQLGTQPISFPTFVIQKTGGASLTLNDSVTVTATATFTSGNVYSSTGNNLIFPAGTGHTGASAASHVVGHVTKIGEDVFTFPVGGPASYNPVTMSAPVGATSRFRAEYKNQNPNIDGYNTNAKAGSFGSAIISNAGYWDVQRLLGATNVTLTFGFGDNPYEQYPVLANLKVAHWSGAQWDDLGNGGITGTSASGTIKNAVPITSFSPFAIAGVVPTYFFSYGQPGPGPDGSSIKLKGIGGYPNYTVKQLPGGTYTSDSIFLVPNGSTTTFRLKDVNGVEKDTTITAPAAPANYISANGNGTVNFTGWRHFVYMRDAGNNIMGAIRDNDLTLGNTTMTTYFSAANVATAPNGNIFLKRSCKITSQFAPAGTKRVRFYISKTEVNDLLVADPASFPNGINSLTIIKYSGPQEENLFNPIPGGNAVIIPNSAIAIADLGTMYSLDIDVTGFSGFYIGGNNSNLNVCSGSTITLPTNIAGTTYQWQADNGSGFANISDGGPYSGTSTSALTITNAPQSLYGYQFRVVVNGGTFSQIYTLKFNASWEGTFSNVWENAANWSCNTLPDANTDVIINAGKPNYPQLNSNTTIRSLRLNNGASGTVKTGFTLTILK